MDKKFLSLEPLPVDCARSIISNLVSLYQQGMRMPLPFFPESSYAFALHQPQPSPIEEVGGEEGTENKGMIEARKKWISGKYHQGEGEDSAYQLCFREEPFQNTEFEKIAREIYVPFIEASEAGGEGEQ